MWKLLWRQVVWPNVLRPMLRDHGLQLTTADYQAIAAQIEIERNAGPVTAYIVKTVWTVDVINPVIDAIGRL